MKQPTTEVANDLPSLQLSGSKRKFAQISKPTTVLLIQNMVPSADNVDTQELANETKEECSKYGQVLHCEIYVLSCHQYRRLPEEKRVRVFIQFQKQDAAVKAWKEMNGRYFGGRKLIASFYHEERFAKRSFEPDEEEFE
jgi:splicing factor 45